MMVKIAIGDFFKNTFLGNLAGLFVFFSPIFVSSFVF
jgi:hypothetical protein